MMARIFAAADGTAKLRSARRPPAEPARADIPIAGKDPDDPVRSIAFHPSGAHEGMTKRLVVVTGALVVACCFGCGRDPDAVQEGRIDAVSISPNGKVEAVVVLPGLDGFGATISQPYQVFLRSLRPGVKETKVVFGADKTDGVRLRWQGEQLVICYADAQILRFRNQFNVWQNHRMVDEIEIVLHRVSKLGDC